MSAFDQRSLAVGHVVGAHPFSRQMRASMFLLSVRKNAKQMFVKPSDGPVSELDSANVIPTLPVHAKPS